MTDGGMWGFTLIDIDASGTLGRDDWIEPVYVLDSLLGDDEAFGWKHGPALIEALLARETKLKGHCQ